MNAPAPTNARTRVALLVLAATVAVAASTRYASALTTPPSLDPGAGATLAARGDTTCLMGAAAAQARNSVVPRYPDALKGADVEGEVLVAFVVRPTGKADAATLKVIRSTNEQFTEAVKSALPNMSFVAPEVGGRKVSQLVQQPYFFEIKTTPNVPAASCSAPGQKGIWMLAGIVVRAP